MSTSSNTRAKGAPKTQISPVAAASMKPYKRAPAPTVLVIGAGIAGLSCARYITKQNARVVVLEARDRPGGRIHTATLSGSVGDEKLSAPADMGAGWIHGTDANPLALIAQRLNLETYCTSSSSSVLYDHDLQSCTLYDDNGVRIEQHVLQRAMSFFERVMADLVVGENAVDADDVPLEPNEPAKTASDLMRRARRLAEQELKADPTATPQLIEHVQCVISWYFYRLEGWFAAPSSEISVTQIRNEGILPGGHHLIKSGYSRVIEYLCSKPEPLDIRYNQVVTNIKWTDDGVEVMTSGGAKYTANAACVALPVQIINSGAVTFTPSLPAWKREAHRKMGPGQENKVILMFERAFWPNVDFFGVAGKSTLNCSYFLNLQPAIGKPLIAFMCTGEDADFLNKCTREQAVEHVMKQLRQCFPREQVPEPLDGTHSSWGADEFSLAAYSYELVNDASERKQLFSNLRKRCGSLRWAGEYMHPRFIGTAHGAYLCGKQAGRFIMLDHGNRMPFASSHIVRPRL